MGGTIGIIALRFLAGLFIRWLQEFTHLEDAGYLAVALVGLRLLLRVVSPDLVPPEWVMVSLIAAFFVWGFSQRTQMPLENSPKALEVSKDALEIEIQMPLENSPKALEVSKEALESLQKS